MKLKTFVILLLLSLWFTACSAGGNAAPATPELIPTVLADNTIIAEGRVEPVHYAEIAFNVSSLTC